MYAWYALVTDISEIYDIESMKRLYDCICASIQRPYSLQAFFWEMRNMAFNKNHPSASGIKLTFLRNLTEAKIQIAL